MRIRRRPPGQPLAYLLPTDPYPAPQSPPPASGDHQERRLPPPPPPGDKQGDGELHLHPAANDSAADLGDDARRSSSSSSSPLKRPALPPPQDDDGAVERSKGLLLGAQQQQQQQGPADGRSGSSLENNGLHLHVLEPAMNQAGELLSNNDGIGAAVAVTATATTGAKATKKQQQQEKKEASGGGTKRAPRGPGTLLEGSRCSRKNGRGWRCSQPTLVGYALCQYHLGKGRMKSGSAATVGRGPGQLGRTEHTTKKTGRGEHSAKKTSAAAAPAAPKADVPPPPPPPSVQHC